MRVQFQLRTHTLTAAKGMPQWARRHQATGLERVLQPVSRDMRELLARPLCFGEEKGVSMTVSLDARQSLAEIEHALFKSFPFASTSITHVTNSDGVVTIQVSWVASAGSMSILDSRCALSLVMEPGVLERYRALPGAKRLRAREALCAHAEDALRRHLPAGGTDLAECNLMLGVDAAIFADAERGQA